MSLPVFSTISRVYNGLTTIPISSHRWNVVFKNSSYIIYNQLNMTILGTCDAIRNGRHLGGALSDATEYSLD